MILSKAILNVVEILLNITLILFFQFMILSKAIFNVVEIKPILREEREIEPIQMVGRINPKEKFLELNYVHESMPRNNKKSHIGLIYQP